MKTVKTMPADYEQIVKVSELKNLARIIAEKMIKVHGFYACMINDKKTLVLP